MHARSTNRSSARSITTAAIAIIAAAGLHAPAAEAAAGITQPARSTLSEADRDPRTVTLARLSARIEANFQDQPIKDVFNYLAQVTQADIIVYYEDDIVVDGILADDPITMNVKQRPALDVIDRLLRTLNTASPISEFTWQMDETGAIEIGPKTALDRNTRTQAYDIGDLVFEIPNFTNAPEFDLQTSGGQGGGGQSSIQGSGGQDTDRLSKAERVDQLVNTIQTIVEPNAWVVNGGTSATLSQVQTTLLVTAPDYVHRSLGGYAFWPSRLQSTSFADGRKQTNIRPLRQRPGP